MDCNLMLQSAFDWAKKGKISGGEFPLYAKVFATVTIHHSLDRPEKTSDAVWYANGPLHFQRGKHGQFLTGNIQSWINKVQDVYLPPKPGDIFGDLVEDLFPNSHKLKLLLSVSQSGVITVGKLINGNLIGGVPPSTFQASCENELLTGRVDILGQAVCTVSFSLGSSVGMP